MGHRVHRRGAVFAPPPLAPTLVPTFALDPTHPSRSCHRYLGLKQFYLQGATSVAIIYEDLGNYFFTGVGTESRIIAESFGYDIRLSANFSYNEDGDADLDALVALLADAVATEADVLVLCTYNSAAKMAFRKLKSMRDTHAFDMVWAPQPVSDGSARLLATAGSATTLRPLACALLALLRPTSAPPPPTRASG